MSLSRMGVVGAGQMGRGIAQVLATAGLDVVLVDVDVAAAQRGLETLARGLEGQVRKGKLDPDARDHIVARVCVGPDLASLGGVDMVIEAASENAALKRELFGRLDGICPPHAILASNTSSLSITALSAQTKRPDKVIGMHFMNPVPVMKLVEVIRGLPTSDDTYATVAGLAEALGKTIVTSRDIPGFVVNRILMPLVNEACFALYEGIATAEDIDKGCVLGLNHPLGPLALMDLIGLDTTLAILEVLHRELGEDKYRPCPLLRQYVAAGWYGRKVGRGFFTYAG